MKGINQPHFQGIFNNFKYNILEQMRLLSWQLDRMMLPSRAHCLLSAWAK